MNQNILEGIKEVINNWLEDKGNFLFQDKTSNWVKNPGISGEYLIKFSVQLKTFLCDGILIPIELISDTFQTTTLSSSNEDNIDINNLEKFLKNFDQQLYDLVDKKIKECKGIVTTTDILHMK